MSNETGIQAVILAGTELPLLLRAPNQKVSVPGHDIDPRRHGGGSDRWKTSLRSTDNSPAFQGWDPNRPGTRECRQARKNGSVVPAGTLDKIVCRYPALKRWAIIRGPSTLDVAAAD
jgi:hypothetical protein